MIIKEYWAKGYAGVSVVFSIKNSGPYFSVFQSSLGLTVDFLCFRLSMFLCDFEKVGRSSMKMATEAAEALEEIMKDQQNVKPNLLAATDETQDVMDDMSGAGKALLNAVVEIVDSYKGTETGRSLDIILSRHGFNITPMDGGNRTIQ